MSRAINVATRRSAACSSASACNLWWALAFEIAVAISSVKSSRRASVSAGNGSSLLDVAVITPQVRPSIETGTPIA